MGRATGGSGMNAGGHCRQEAEWRFKDGWGLLACADARIPETAFPEPYVLTETENKIIDDILELLNKNGLTSHQSQNLLERLGEFIEMGQRVAKGTTH
jgi:hypothetical protein